MARLNIESSVYSDPRFMDLMIKLGDKYKAIGMLVAAWTLAQKHWLEFQAIPCELWPSEFDILIDVGLAKVDFEACKVYIRGSHDQFKWLEQKQGAGKKSGESRKKATKTPKKRERTSTGVQRTLTGVNGGEPLTPTLSLSPPHSLPPPQTQTLALNTYDGVQDGPPPPTLNFQIWDAYRIAYFDRYQVEAKRNAKINSQIDQLGKRLGSEAVPVVEFFLKHMDSRYLKNTHSFGFCLLDAETLRTQWLKGQTITGLDVRRYEKRVEQESVGITQAEIDEVNRIVLSKTKGVVPCGQ